MFRNVSAGIASVGRHAYNALAAAGRLLRTIHSAWEDAQQHMIPMTLLGLLTGATATIARLGQGPAWI